MQELVHEAEQCYRQEIAANAEDEEAYLNLAMVCRTQGKYQQAKNAAETAIAYCPQYPEAIKLLQSLEGVAEARQLVGMTNKEGNS